MLRFSEYSGKVETLIRALQLPGGELAGLYEPITYALQAGGKRLRPALCMMAADAFGNAADQASDAAVGLEMFHNFTLLHDDVMDQSPLRRGRATVHSKWDVNTAILSGDTMLTLATQLVAKVEDSKLRIVLDAFNEMAIRVYEGQCLDMAFENRQNVTTAEYIRMIGDKTGALLGAACMIGAVIGGASKEDADSMYEFGMMLGLAFQVQDDWLDTYGDANTFGKPIGGDINNGKKTYLLVSGLERNDADSKALSEAMALPAGDLRVKVVRNIYDRMGLSEDCRKEVAEYSAKAMAALKATSLDEERREPFRKIVEKLTGRKK
jgi:geranylgeranyl diphosphate synthase type II